MDQVQHHSAKVNGINIHYVTEGKGFPVILIHGWPGAWFTWRKQIPVLAKDFEVIAVDIRGSGDSDKPTCGYDTRTLASDIYQLVQTLGYRKVALVGHSMGVRIAYRYCLDHPDEVDRVALLDTTHPLDPAAAGMVGPLTSEQARSKWHNLFHSLPELPEQLVHGHEEVYLRYLMRSWSGNRDVFTDEEIAQYVRCYSQPGALRGGFNLYRAAAYEDPPAWGADADRQLFMPLLYLWSDFEKKRRKEVGIDSVEL